MTLTARQLRQPPTIEAIERVPYFADVGERIGIKVLYKDYLVKVLLVPIRHLSCETPKI